MNPESTRARAAAKLERQTMAGIPDSVLHGGTGSATAGNPVLNCHVGGILISSLPVEAQGRLLYQQTDEGIAEANVGKSTSGNRVLTDDFDNTLRHKKDAVREMGMEFDEAPDPLREVADAHKRPGFSQKFLSPRLMGQRGMRGYVAVTNEKGDQVRVRDLVLAEQPTSQVERRARQNQDRSGRMLGEITKTYLEEGGASAVAD